MVNLPKCKSDHKCIIYPNILSSIAPVDHYDDLPIPVPPDNEHSTRGYSSDESQSTESCINSDKDYYPGFESRMHVLTQQDIDYLVRDLENRCNIRN